MVSVVVTMLLLMAAATATAAGGRGGGVRRRRILVDTDVDTDDVFAILYLLKQDRSEFDLKVRA